MKLTQILYQQHLGRAIRKLWQMKREMVIPVTPAQSILTSMGHEVVDANEMVQEVLRKARMQPIEMPQLQPFIEEVVEPKEVPVHLYEAGYALQAGLDQARLLTNTAIKDNKLPEAYNLESIPEQLDIHVQKVVANSAIFDAHQELLPKIKDPERPMFVFPRLYGITQHRRTHNLVSRLLHLCECMSGGDVSQRLFVEFKSDIVLRLERFETTLQCNVPVDTLVRSRNPLEPVESTPGRRSEYEMPDIYPLAPLISIPSMEKARQPKLTTWTSSPWNNIHTVFVYHNPEMVKNLTELPVTEDQITARTLMNVFAAAANCALNTHQLDIERLSRPMTVQCVQTDGQDFVFSVFQLNGMSEDLVNYWWIGPKLRLYQKAMYENGRPVLTEYNPDVFRSMLAFYCHQ